MADSIRKARPDAAVETLGESNQLGLFDVMVNDSRVWSKHETDEFPEAVTLIAQLPAMKAPGA